MIQVADELDSGFSILKFLIFGQIIKTALNTMNKHMLVNSV